jgi:hypothetical protein
MRLALLTLPLLATTLLAAAPAPLQRNWATTNVNPVAPMPVVTVSSQGIRNGQSSVTNAGMRFGPDTPGTVTSGLQEAYDAMNKGTNFGPYAAGTSIQLGPGYFFYTNKLVFSNTFTTGIKIVGSTGLESKLVYAGAETGIKCIEIRGGHNPNVGTLDIPMHVTIRDVGFSALNNTTNILLLVTNISHAEITGCNFTQWQIMTNQVWGSGQSIAGGAPFPVGNLVGLVIGNDYEHGTFLNMNYF